jgi:hypothetical protein
MRFRANESAVQINIARLFAFAPPARFASALDRAGNKVG